MTIIIVAVSYFSQRNPAMAQFQYVADGCQNANLYYRSGPGE